MILLLFLYSLSHSICFFLLLADMVSIERYSLYIIVILASMVSKMRNNNKNFKSLIIIRQNMDDDDKNIHSTYAHAQKKSTKGILIHTHITNLCSNNCEDDVHNTNNNLKKIKANTCREWQQQGSEKKNSKLKRRDLTTTAHTHTPFRKTCTSACEKGTDDHISVIYCIFLLIK